ncbi:conserved Plasmodium protein, unknown function [Plasmodium relictum]|uniref:Uncharacterized protein n=1 Tax=Plasmodium relictum TaxID=85471 RepID=A0A1J1H862_PLARL|nr:conserved Plasmodium protein, unknown function [Plasmodium relictum]CRG99789.1 conserved Plasmodium protein, unknown function [Plasmodium relictum]
MLENLCINLMNELFLAKHNFLIFIILNNLHKNGTSNKRVKKKKITVNEKNELIDYTYFNIIKKDYYLKFSIIKEKHIKRKRKIRMIFKKLRKTIINMNKNYNRYKKNYFNIINEPNYNEFFQKNILLLHSFESNFIFNKIYCRIINKINCMNKKKSVKIFKKKFLCNKLEDRSNFTHICNRKEYLKYLNRNLHKYIYKDIYNFLPNYNFEKESNLIKKKKNCVFSEEKVNRILKKKKEIVKKVCIKNKTYILSSKKLKKRYIEFFEKFHSFLDNLKVDKKDETKQLIADYKVLKTLLYLKNSSISKKLDNNSLIKSKNYKIYEAISMISYLKKGLYILKMDIIYIYIFFCSYINNIFAKLKKIY